MYARGYSILGIVGLKEAGEDQNKSRGRGVIPSGFKHFPWNPWFGSYHDRKVSFSRSERWFDSE